MKRIISVLLPFLLLTVSCSTITHKQAAAAASNVTELLGSGDVDALTGQSGTPFLFETEILPAPAQLAALWDGLAASGYNFGPGGEITVLDTDDDTWKRFSSSREVQVWFDRHAPENAVLALVPTTDGQLVLVIDRSIRTSERIRGLKVEQ